jgi:hypothetical protein
VSWTPDSSVKPGNYKAVVTWNMGPFGKVKTEKAFAVR